LGKTATPPRKTVTRPAGKASQAPPVPVNGQVDLSFIPTGLEGLLACLPLALIGIDADGKIALWSSGSQEILQLPGEKALGQPISRLLKKLAQQHRAPGLEGLGVLLQTQPTDTSLASGWRFEFTSAAEPRLIQAEYLAFADGAGGMLILQDVTARQNLEESTREVGHLAALGQLAACIAHEVRNPLSAVKGAAQLLQEEDPENEIVARYAGIISIESQRLERLVNDFLAHSRPPSYRFLPVAVGDLLKRCCNLLERDARGRGVDIDCRQQQALPVILADAEALLQALLNLGRNALEASPAGSRVSITARLNVASPTVMEIIIKDNGDGIAGKDLTQIFVPFFTTKQEGTGLGLPIARKIIESHGGSLTLASKPGQGTRVKILLQLPNQSVSKE
jgi:signal transduction histidine kinase